MEVSKSWAFTLNNYTEGDIQLFKDLECNFMVFGREVGESGTPHLQGAVVFRTAKRLSGLKKIHSKCHWSPGIDEEACVNYCMKDQDYFLKDNRQQGKRSDLESFISAVKNQGKKKAVLEYPEVYVKFHGGLDKLSTIYYDKPRDFVPTVIWIYGPTGVGKTKYIYDRHNAEDIWTSLEDGRFWEGYENQEVVLLDDFRADFCKFHVLLKILDRYPYRVQVKGSSRQLNSKYMYITSPYSPYEVYSSKSQEDVKQLIRRISKIIFLDILNGEVQTSERQTTI